MAVNFKNEYNTIFEVYLSTVLHFLFEKKAGLANPTWRLYIRDRISWYLNLLAFVCYDARKQNYRNKCEAIRRSSCMQLVCLLKSRRFHAEFNAFSPSLAAEKWRRGFAAEFSRRTLDWNFFYIVCPTGSGPFGNKRIPNREHPLKPFNTNNKAVRILSRGLSNTCPHPKIHGKVKMRHQSCCRIGGRGRLGYYSAL